MKTPRPERDAYYAAVDLLARREHSRAELEAKLLKKGCAQESITLAINQLAEQGLQSDQRYVEDFVRSRILKGNGPVRVTQELRLRGVEESILETYLNEQTIDWLEIAKATYQKKYKGNNEIDLREKARRVRFMQSKGFPSDIIFQLFE